MLSRRDFLGKTAVAAAAVTASASPALPAAVPAPNYATAEILTLCGLWKFRLDPRNLGMKEAWFGADHSVGDWQDVSVPHTWQIVPASADYRGVAWYQRQFNVPAVWSDSVIRVEFEAVFHSASVWVNGRKVGEHLLKGYTAFAFDITSALRRGQPNNISVRVDSAFNEHMLPRGRSSDWAHDGGIFRPVQLLITPKTFIEHLEIDAVPDLSGGIAELTISAFLKNAGTTPWRGTARFRVINDETGLAVSIDSEPSSLSIQPGGSRTLTMKGSLLNPRLWHFDSPKLYRLEFSVSNGSNGHQLEAIFGVRSFDIRDGQFRLNGEHVRLMGVERMAGSNPEFGMAETAEWIDHDHRELGHLNCVFTRVHWPQDKRVLDYCDRRGILMQTEIPSWGSDTFQGMEAQTDSDIMENGLEQLREMISRDRNHPCVVVWGLCNEIGGQNPPAYQFAKRMLEEAKRLDPARLCSYASNSLDTTPQHDVAGLMDFIETNEYFGTWAPGNAQDAGKHLDELHAAFPGKPIVISEYGYCACAADRPEGDEHRIEILRTHDAAIRARSFVSGAIFFCYNDYRTHVGDRGAGPLQQRVHGVVDVYGAPKPSYQVLREESSPVESLSIENQLNNFHVLLKTRVNLPAYTLRNYKLLGVFYGQGEIPVELQQVDVPELSPGRFVRLDLTFTQPQPPVHVRFDVLRPTGVSAFSLNWKP